VLATATTPPLVLATATTPPQAPATQTSPTASVVPADAAEARFTGRITDISFACEVDGSCDLVVDGRKHVHLGHDTRGEPPTEWGDAAGLFTLGREQGPVVGRTVAVFAATTGPDDYTIQGKKTYYVRVLDR
jgi:hypothetical protein